MISRHVRSSAAIFIATFLVAAFQNCDQRNAFRGQSSAGTPTQNNGDITDPAQNNGGSYGGKPYIEPGQCAGGSTVKARVFYRSATDAVMTRDNCAELNPAVPLDPSRFLLDAASADRLFVDGRTFISEPLAPPPADPMRVAYSGFENGLAGWSDYGNNEIITSGHYSGTAGARIGPDFAGFEYDVTSMVQPGRRYYVRAMARAFGSDATKPMIGLKFWNASGGEIGTVGVNITSTSYVKVETSAVIPAGAARVSIFFWTDWGPNTAEADDFEVAWAGD